VGASRHGSIQNIPENPWRRWPVHLTIGEVF
jgi:hypothetical protein